MNYGSNVKLKWVIVDGGLHDVSEYHGIEASDRPKAICPICAMPVIMKLGDTNAHHCAHRADDRCAVTNPETALHLNTKYYIYKQLLGSKELLIERDCTLCIEFADYIWASGWDDVKIEFSLDNRKPDIALLREGKTIAVIEVFATHQVDNRKMDDYKKMGIPWLEVEASTDLYSGPDRWTIDKPLPIIYLYPEIEWKCDRCIKAEKYSEEYYSKNYNILKSIKLVDFYYPRGKSFRNVYYIEEETIDTVKSFYVLERYSFEHESAKIIERVSVDIGKESAVILSKAFKHEVEWYAKNTQSIYDSPMAWLQVAEDFDFEYFINRIMFDKILYPKRYVWWGKEGKWFLPKENRAIKWDRYDNSIKCKL